MHDWKKTIQDIKVRLKELSRARQIPCGAKPFWPAQAPKPIILSPKTRELIALAVAVTTRCDGCIAFHAAEP